LTFFNGSPTVAVAVTTFKAAAFSASRTKNQVGMIWIQALRAACLAEMLENARIIMLLFPNLVTLAFNVVGQLAMFKR
jgi:hypothetical protein